MLGWDVGLRAQDLGLRVWGFSFLGLGVRV